MLIATLFLLAVAHKVRTLATGKAAFEPIMRVSKASRRHANLVLATAAMTELLVATALVAYPPIGFVATCFIVLIYIAALRRLPADEPCNCFGAALRSRDRSTAIQRNVVLMVASIAAVIGDLVAGVDATAVSATSAGLALVLGSFLAAGEAVRRLPPTGHVE